MNCKTVCAEVPRLAGLAPSAIPDAVRQHLATCPACARALAVERVTRGLLASLAQAVPPASGFAERVVASLPRQPAPVPADAWRPAWGLLPAFAAAAVALVIVYGETSSVPAGLLPLETLTAGERLVLQESSSSSDLVLSAIMEETR